MAATRAEPDAPRTTAMPPKITYFTMLGRAKPVEGRKQLDGAAGYLELFPLFPVFQDSAHYLPRSADMIGELLMRGRYEPRALA